eukprot:288060_1
MNDLYSTLIVIICMLLPIGESIKFGFKTATSQQYIYAASNHAITITLFWFPQKYQCFVYPNEFNTSYYCDSSESTTTECDISLSSFIETDYGLQIDNAGTDGVGIDSVSIVDTNNCNQHILNIDYFCVHNNSHRNYNSWIVNDTCLNAVNGGRDLLWIKGESAGHDAYQLVIFDKNTIVTNKNEAYFKALNSSSECSPSACPSHSPTIEPTVYPTMDFTDIHYLNAAICNNLDENIELYYEGTLNECINKCKQINNCTMINYYYYLKSGNDSR